MSDYFNSFNEVLITFEMVPDMLELMDEEKYQPQRSYLDYFYDSSFLDKICD